MTSKQVPVDFKWFVAITSNISLWGIMFEITGWCKIIKCPYLNANKRSWLFLQTYTIVITFHTHVTTFVECIILYTAKRLYLLFCCTSILVVVHAFTAPRIWLLFTHCNTSVFGVVYAFAAPRCFGGIIGGHIDQT